MWSSSLYQQIKQGSCDVNTLTTDIRAIQIPSTDGYVMAALQHNSVSMYDIRFQNGEIYVKLCSHLDAFGVRDLTSFSINGQLYVVVGNGQARMSFVWKYHTQKEEFIFHHRQVN